MKQSEHKKKYTKYIQSTRWAKIRVDLITIYGGCQDCGSTRKLEVHHLNYDNLFFEEPEDLLLLCKCCHLLRHPELASIIKSHHLNYIKSHKGKIKPLPYYRKKLKSTTGKNVKGGRGWRGLARLVAVAFNETWISGTKNQARRYVAGKF